MYNLLGIGLKIFLKSIYILLEECFQIAIIMKMLKLALECACDRRPVHTVAMTISAAPHSLPGQDSVGRIHTIAFLHASHICTSRGGLTHGMVLSRSPGIPVQCSRCGTEPRRGPVENVALAQLPMHPFQLQVTSYDS